MMRRLVAPLAAAALMAAVLLSGQARAQLPYGPPASLGALSITQTQSGAKTGPFIPNSIVIHDSTVVTGDPDPLNRAIGFMTEMFTGGAASGDRIAGLFIVNSNSAASAQANDRIALATQAFVSANINGGLGGEDYGFNPLCNAASGAVTAGCIGTEIDVQLDTGATVGERAGLRIVNQGALTATSAQDAAILVTSTTTTGRFKNYELFSNEFGDFPIAASGSIMASDVAGTVANVFNLPNITVTGDILNFPNVVLSGGGGLSVVEYELSGSPFALLSGDYTRIYDRAGNQSILLGDTNDPANYYNNTVHKFGNIGGGTLYAEIDGTGIQVTGSVSAAGATFSAPANTTALTLSGGSTTGSDTHTLGPVITGTSSSTGTADGLFLSGNLTSNSGPLNAASTLADLQVLGVPKFVVGLAGNLTVGSLGAGNAVTTTTYPPLLVQQRFNSASTVFKLSVFNFEDQSSSALSELAEWQSTGTPVACLLKVSALIVGSCSYGSENDPEVSVTRQVTDSTGTTTGNAHGFADLTVVNRSNGGPIGYNSYDAASSFNGAITYDHYAAFQSRPTFQNTATTSNSYGLYDQPSTNTGATLTNRYGGYVADFGTNAGTVVNQYGFYVTQLSDANTLNYAFFSAGTTPSQFGGVVTFGAPIVRKGYTVAALPASPGTGAFAYATDAVACTFLATLTGGGSTYCPVGYNGSAWVGE